jgi:4a-hydroxytetrahydrobiopterin dehydratase
MSKANDLSSKQCKPCKAGTPPLSNAEAYSLLRPLDGWQRHDKAINKTFPFKNYYQTIAFVNAIAWVSHTEDHHPELTVSYNSCRVEYSTHSVGGLSENDFICAAKIDALLKI